MRTNRPPLAALLPALAALILLLTVPPARAVDGVIEINQARAMAGGVTPGDTPGWPVTISLAGSYRLTSNLDLGTAAGAENLTAILINADDVSLDLNGFAIVGPTVCTYTSSLACTRTGNGYGVAGGTSEGTRLANGTIRGVGNAAAVLGDSSLCSNLTVVSNGGAGVTCTTTQHVEATQNAGVGIWADVVVASYSSRNLGDGIGGLAVYSSTSFLNGGDGLDIGMLAHDNQVAWNGGFGILCNFGCGARGNVLGSNALGNLAGVVQLGPNLCGSALCP